MNAYTDEVRSPVGLMVFATDENGALLGLWFREGRNPASLENRLRRESFTLAHDEERTAPVREQLTGYLTGERRSFDLEVARQGSDFEEAVWEELSRIPFGQTCTYGQVAESIGGVTSAVDVGKACAVNPVLLVVPCHRVVSADGSLKGYAAGLPVKARLLDFEEESQKRLFA